MRILIADDDRLSRTLLEETLAEWGHDVVTCSDGEQAWDALAAPDGPPLAILDWQMPGITGLHLCRMVRAEPSSTHHYLILLTARDSKEDIVSGLEAGANDYVIKPFDREELRARVNVGVRVVELEEKLLEMERDRVMTATAGAAAHEMNQPLAVLVGMSELLLSKAPEDATSRRPLEAMHEAALRISNIVKQMWDAREYSTKPYVEGIHILDFEASSPNGPSSDDDD